MTRLPADRSPRPAPVRHRVILAALAGIVVLAGVVAVPPATTRADDLDEALARQDALQKQIKDQKARIAHLDGLQADLRAEIAATRSALAQVNADLTVVRTRIADTEKRIDVIRAAYVALSRQIDEQSALIERTIRAQWRREVELADRRALLADRIRASYVTRRTSLLETFLSGDSFTDVLTEAAYFLDVGEQDKALAQEIARRAAALAAERQALDEARAQARAMRVEKERQKDELDGALADLRVAKKQLQKLEKETARALASQRAAYAKMARNEKAMRRTLAQRQAAQRALERKIDDLLAKQEERGKVPSEFNGTLRWPMAGRVTQDYGCTGFAWEPPLGDCAHFHKGIDIAAPMYTPIRAAGSGTVLFAGPNPYDPYPKAWIVIIAHSQNLLTWYGHVDNAVKPPAVRAGQEVAKGQVIAYNGSTGRSTGPHLHWMVQRNGTFVNPRLFL